MIESHMWVLQGYDNIVVTQDGETHELYITGMREGELWKIMKFEACGYGDFWTEVVYKPEVMPE
jgi:hypothetical protein